MGDLRVGLAGNDAPSARRLSIALAGRDCIRAGSRFTDANRLIGRSRDGLPFELAVNVLNDSEFAGACFSPDGEILFVNVFGGSAPGSGMTYAITGPWCRGRCNRTRNEERAAIGPPFFV